MNFTAALFVWGTVDIITVDEDALNNWWSNEHLPERLSLPGFQRAYRYCSPATSDSKRRYLAVYDVQSIEALQTRPYINVLKAPTPDTAKFMSRLKSLDRAACETRFVSFRVEAHDHVACALGNWIVVIVFDAKDDDIVSKIKAFEQNKKKSASLLSTKLYLRSEEAATIGNVTKSYEDVTFHDKTPSEFTCQFVYVIEFALPVPGDVLEREAEVFISRFKDEDTASWSWEAYQLIYSMEKKNVPKDTG